MGSSGVQASVVSGIDKGCFGLFSSEFLDPAELSTVLIVFTCAAEGP